MSQSSLDAPAERAGRWLDPARFRGNSWIDGAPARAEETWLGRRIAVGEVVLEGIEPIERCRAVDADPATGGRDTDLRRDLHALRGAPNFGLFVRVLQGGRIRVGDAAAPGA